jgi:hypothetical protein
VSKKQSAIIDYRRKAIGGIGKVKVNELPKPREGRRTTYLRMRLRGDRQRPVKSAKCMAPRVSPENSATFSPCS